MFYSLRMSIENKTLKQNTCILFGIVRTLTRYSRINYMDQCVTKAGVTCVYSGHVLYTLL